MSQFCISRQNYLVLIYVFILLYLVAYLLKNFVSLETEISQFAYCDIFYLILLCCAQSCPTLCDPMDCSSSTYQAPLSMWFSRPECWSGLQFPYPGDLPNPVIEPKSLVSPALAGFAQIQLLICPWFFPFLLQFNSFCGFYVSCALHPKCFMLGCCFLIDFIFPYCLLQKIHSLFQCTCSKFTLKAKLSLSISYPVPYALDLGFL